MLCDFNYVCIQPRFDVVDGSQFLHKGFFSGAFCYHLGELLQFLDICGV